MFGFARDLNAMVHDSLYRRSCLGVAVIDREHQIIATNAEMDRINGFKHPGEPVRPDDHMPEVVDDIREHVDAVFGVGEPVFNVRVKGPGKGRARRAYFCDYLPCPESGAVEYVVAVVRPAQPARRGRPMEAEARDQRDAPLP
ncbi:MAG: PAS domain-containing protein [Oceanicaulis sp.]